MTIYTSANATSTAAIASTGSQISKQNETIYHQSNLLGTWTGKWTGNKQPITFKVLKITGGSAEIEYTHNGKTEKGQAQVTQNLVTYGSITIGTKDGTKGAIEFSAGTVKQTGTLTKSADTSAAATADPTKLVGSWSGLTSSGNAASFTVKSVTGTSADLTYTVNGITRKGTGSYNATNHVISFMGAQLRSSDGSAGSVTFTSIGKTYSVPVKKASPSTSKTSTFA
jgi:hypothetical protein